MRGRVQRSGPAPVSLVAHNRVIDLVRAGAIGVVVVGHWLMAAFYLDPDRGLRRADILGLATWSHPLTWALQVMPLFFMVGGYVNAISWRNAQQRGTTYGAWLRRRLRRLLGPLLPLMVFWTVVAPAASSLGVAPSTLRLVTRASLVPTWFLAVYVLVIAAAPWSLRLWDRYGWGTIAAGLVGGAVVDAVTFQTGVDALGVLNLVFVWGTMHQLGYAWRDDRLGATPGRLGLFAAGLGGAVLAVWAGPYAVSMVGVEGYGTNNTYPPRVTLALLGLAQVGLTTAAEPWLRRLVARASVWRWVMAVNARIMTIYLWHLTAVTLLVAVSLTFGGYGLAAVPDTSAWWWSRPAWCLALAALTAIPVALVGRFELPGPDPRPAPHGLIPVSAMLVTGFAVAAMAEYGIAGPDGSVTWWLPLVPVLACFGLGVFALPGRSLAPVQD